MNDKKTSENFRLNSIKQEIGYWLGFLSSILGIIQLFIATPLWFRISWLVMIGLFILFAILKVISFIKNGFDIKDELTKKFNLLIKNTCDEIHKYAHNIRDYICSSSNRVAEKDYFAQICKSICSDIEQSFHVLWNDNEVSVCIKRIVTDEIMDDDFKNWLLKTIARSAGTKQDRFRNDEKAITIENNSDFFIILSPNYKDSIFASPDLTNIEKDFIEQYDIKYKNTTENYLNYYKSTIVVPIRITFDRVNALIKKCYTEKFAYHIVGFLCIDSKNNFQNNLDVFQAGVNLAKSFADTMYKLFENNIVYTIEEKERKL